MLRAVILDIARRHGERERKWKAIPTASRMYHQKQKEDIKSETSGCGSFVVLYFQPATAIDCLHAINRVHCALGYLYILSTLLFLFCALQAHIRCKRLTNCSYTVHYIYIAMGPGHNGTWTQLANPLDLGLSLGQGCHIQIYTRVKYESKSFSM